MIIYSVRALNIIEILKNSHDPVSSLALSEEIGCSTKTIQSEIKDINKNSKDGKIVSIRGIGYKIEGSFDDIAIPSQYLGNVDRIDYIIKNLINLTTKPENTVKLEELADSMYISVSTVKNDLKEVKEILSKYDTLNIPVFIDRSIDEEDELAQAEWLKVYGAIFDCEDKAEAIYAELTK